MRQDEHRRVGSGGRGEDETVRFHGLLSGPGLGGHCIPIDPFYLSWKAKQTGFDPRFIELAGHINAGMPHYVVDKVGEALNTKRKAINGSKVLVAGIAYKRDIDDMRESPALDVMGLLHAKGAIVSYADPFVPELARPASGPAVTTSRLSISRAARSASTTAWSSSPITRRSTTTPSWRKPTSSSTPVTRSRNGTPTFSGSVHRTPKENGRPHCRRNSWPAHCNLSGHAYGRGVLGVNVVILYIYLGYPVLLATRARLAPRPVHKAPVDADPASWPSVSIILAARNEAVSPPGPAGQPTRAHLPGVPGDYRRLGRLYRRHSVRRDSISFGCMRCCGAIGADDRGSRRAASPLASNAG